MEKSLKEKCLFLIEERVVSSFAIMIILLSILLNNIIILWIGILVYILEILLNKYFFKFKKISKKNKEKSECKVIDFDFKEKKIK